MQQKPLARRTCAGLFGVHLAVLLACGVLPASAAAAEFNPELIISNDNMRNRDAMSAPEIQALLDTLPGPLKSLVTTDYAGVERPASSIIWRACQEWSISPKVMLTMLQKEQSLLTRTTLAKNTLSRAIGAGCPDATTNRFPGFGMQMWHGARLLDGYGEPQDSPRIRLYFPGISVRDIYRNPKVTLYPKNIATYKLFVYNPSIGAAAPYGDLSSQRGTTSGNANFWLIYRRYFGSTFAQPRMRPVYRFRKRSNGSYLFTCSVAEKVKLTSGAYRAGWEYKGVGFSVDGSATASTVPVYRFYNKRTRTYSFTASQRAFESRRTTAGRLVWRYQGVAFRVAKQRSVGSTTVWRFKNRKTGARWLTASAAFVERYRTEGDVRRRWEYEGIAFHLPRFQPVGP